MSGEETYPATVGQLSVWRDIERMPADRRWEANLSFVWDVPPGPDGAPPAPEAVWAAIGALGMRHGSLRTTYEIGDDGFPRQRIAAHTAGEVLAEVRQDTADVAQLEAVEATGQRTTIDVTSTLPWRVWLLTEDGTPAKLLVVVNHMAADGVAAVVMREDFQTILGGTDLPPEPGPLELALNQQGEGSSRLRNAERYWRRTLASAPHRTAEGTPTPVGVMLRTGIPMPVANEAVAKFEVSLQSLVLAAYYRAICHVTGENAVLLYPMTANRLDEEHARVVTSLNQWTPLVLDLDPAEPFADIVPKVHWKAFNALKNGLCSPDAIWQIRDEHERMDPPVDPGFYYNPMMTAPDFPSQDTLTAPQLDWFEPPRATGPGFYLITRGITSLDLVVRVIRPGFDRESVTALVHDLQNTFADTLGGQRL